MIKKTSLFANEDEQRFCGLTTRLTYCNPFLPERIELERKILRDDYVGSDTTWNIKADLDEQRHNISKIVERAEAVTAGLRKQLMLGTVASAENVISYEDIVLFILYHRYNMKFQEIIDCPETKENISKHFDFFLDFRKDVQYFFNINAIDLSARNNEAYHLFAFFFQIRRAFHYIFRYIVGSSISAAKLRAEVWQSIFTHDLKKCKENLYRIMGDMTTIIIGQSGTGKELVARAIGMSHYIPFNPGTKKFTENFRNIFSPVNISALAPTLIESELFGHKKGSFTGALQDRVGWLESCSPSGTIFFDEIGELDASIQVKLLRVMQDRTFQRLGETKTLHFKGKIVVATNKNLTEEMDRGNFRRDFYYRLCSDMITTPSLYDRLRESPEEIYNLTLYIAKRLVGDGAEQLTDKVVNWINKNLGPDYRWAGNIRELEQCVRNMLIRNKYIPADCTENDPRKWLINGFISGSLTSEELLAQYCTLVYSKTKSYQETAKRLDIDRRTVKSRIDQKLFEKLSNLS